MPCEAQDHTQSALPAALPVALGALTVGSTCRLSQLVFGFVDLLLQPQHLRSSAEPDAMQRAAVEFCASWLLALSSCRSTRSSTLQASLPIFIFTGLKHGTVVASMPRGLQPAQDAKSSTTAVP